MTTVMLPNVPGERPGLPSQCPICKSPVETADMNQVVYTCGAAYRPMATADGPAWGGDHPDLPDGAGLTEDDKAELNAKYGAIGATVDATVAGGQMVADPSGPNWKINSRADQGALNAALQKTISFGLADYMHKSVSDPTDIIQHLAIIIEQMLVTGIVPGPTP